MADGVIRKRIDTKIEDFVRSFLGDIYGCFSYAAKLNIEFPSDLEENRCVPNYFFSKMLDFSQPFVKELLIEMNHLPALLYVSDDFFKRFAFSVCMKLIKGEDDDLVSFLKVTLFLLIFIATTFTNSCYRILDDIPIVYRKMLEDHLSTKFYIEDKFEDVIVKLHELELDEIWVSKTLDNIRRFMGEACTAEIPLTKISPESLEERAVNLRILDMRKKSLQSDSDIVRCIFCGLDCAMFVRVFFQPRIKYKPDCPVQ